MAPFQHSFKNFDRAFTSLKAGLSGKIEKEIEIAGCIKMFELCFETGWKALKVYLEEKQGVLAQGPKPVLQEAYKLNLIDQEKEWLSILQDRNLSVHVYEKKDAVELVQRIKEKHLKAFELLWQKIKP